MNFSDVEWHKLYRAFPTCIFQVKLPDSEQINATLEKEIYRMREDEGDRSRWQSNDQLHLSKEFEDLTNWIRGVAKSVLDYMQYEYDNYEITGMWANILKPNEMHDPHTHSNNFLSGAYYVKSRGDDSGKKIFFHDPRPQAHVMRPAVKQFTVDNYSGMSLPSIEGSMVVFPSWVLHYVKVNGGTEDRISISWNIMLRGSINRPGSLQYAEFD